MASLPLTHSFEASDKVRRNQDLLQAVCGERRMKAKVNEQNVIKANAQFWEQMLAMSPESTPQEKLCLGAGHMFGVVALKGVWNGHVEVRMASGLAYEATAAMMM